MRRARNIDANQPDVVDELRKEGCVVEVTSDVGRGFPDLVVLTPKGRAVLAEVKNPDQPLSKQQLTPDEAMLAARWGSSYVILKTRDDARALART